MFTKIPPAAAGGSFNPNPPRTLKILRNPTGGSRWIIQSQPFFPVVGRAGRDWTIHRLPPVGFRKARTCV